jgi:hypothetical protein
MTESSSDQKLIDELDELLNVRVSVTASRQQDPHPDILNGSQTTGCGFNCSSSDH